MAAAVLRWDIEQGSPFLLVMTLTTQEQPPQPIVLTGYQARSHLRPHRGRDAPLLYELTTGNGRLTIDGPAGKLTVRIPAEDSSAWEWLEAVYDLELVAPSGEPTRLLEGPVCVDPEVTR
ncbi:hypothetical protein GCM10017673_39170 [Streptosporangium violaceochromogenes]|nr:hypothetical protein GCM10017673_39170 [Streptosporangium violaceochromogenes]